MKTMNSYPNKKLVHEYGIVNPSPVFQQAVDEDSNRVSDWEWYAEQLENEIERLYCFERIIYINPNNRTALKAVQTIKNAKRVQFADIRHSSPIVRLFRGAGA